jgi:hypothetical protein
MHKVIKVEGGYQIFWYPFAPVHFNDGIPYDGKIYSKKQAAYRKLAQIKEQMAEKKSEAESAVA